MRNMEIVSVAVSSFVFFLLFRPVFLNPIPMLQEEKDFSKRCPPFQCNWEIISYPFTNKADDEKCGPFLVKNCNQIMLDKRSNKTYQLGEILQHWDLSIIRVADKELEQNLNSKSCESFKDLNFTTDTHIHFKFLKSSSLTLFKCPHNIKPNSSWLHHNCKDGFNIFYSDSINQLPSNTCSTIRLPKSTSNSYNSDIFELLTANFSLQINISEFSFCKHCMHEGGSCRQNKSTTQCKCPSGIPINFTGQYVPFTTLCSPQPKAPPPTQDTETQRGALILSLGIGCGIAISAILVLAGICYRQRSKRKTSQNHTSGALLKSDMDCTSIYFEVSVFSPSELEEATNNFASENELGEGGFGTVYYGKLRDGREVAVKRLYDRSYKKVNQFMNEIEILTQLRHQNLVSLYGCTSRRSRELLLVYEYIPNGTVADHLYGNRAKSSPIPWPIRLRISIETASALVYLHASEIVHRDVKTNNILLDNNFCVKVADFGISRLLPTNLTHISTAPQGTPGYVDPEYFNCYQLTEKSDVFSFGVVLAELLSSMPAVDITRERHDINLSNLAINKIQQCAFDEFIDPSLGYQSDEEVKRMTILVAEVAFLCLQQDKEMRPSMDEVLEELQRIESGEREPDTADEEENDNVSIVKSVDQFSR